MLTQCSENQIIEYCHGHGIDVRDIYCLDCGELIRYENTDIHIQTKNGAKFKKGDMVFNGLTFLSTRNYNGNIYKLCRCEKCVRNKFPQLNKKGLFTAMVSLSTKYAFNVSDDDFKMYCKTRQSLTLEKFKEKYGEDVGTKRFDNYRLKQSIKNTFEFKKEKYGFDEVQFNDYNKSRSITLENLIRKHGVELGTRKWNDYRERQRYTTSKEYFLEKYGNEIGELKYKEYYNARRKNGCCSKIANKCFEEIIDELVLQDHEIYFDKLNYEYDVDGYRLDFYDKTSNIAIEFYGDLWHCNPKFYKNDDLMTNPFNGETYKAEDIWLKDENRKKTIIEKLGCEFIEIFEDEWKHNKRQITNNIRDLYTHRQL